mgnify:CR=1 FL=1
MTLSPTAYLPPNFSTAVSFDRLSASCKVSLSARALTTAVNQTEHLNVMNRGHVVSLGEPPPNKCGNFFGQCFWNVYGQEVTVVRMSDKELRSELVVMVVPKVPSVISLTIPIIEGRAKLY